VDIETARGISARIWCDPDYSHFEMDVKLTEEIAYKLLECAQRAVEAVGQDYVFKNYFINSRRR